MDEEAREVLEMTKEELLARRDADRPAKVSRKPRTDVAMTAGRDEIYSLAGRFAASRVGAQQS